MKRIKERREALRPRVSQINLASKAGISPSLLRMIEQGYAPERGDSLDRVSEALTELENEREAV